MIAPHYTNAPSHYTFARYSHNQTTSTSQPHHFSIPYATYCYYPPMHAPIRAAEPHLYSQSPPITASAATFYDPKKKSSKASKRFNTSITNSNNSSSLDMGDDPTNPGESNSKKNKTVPFASSLDNKLGIVKKRNCNQRLNSNGGGGQKIEITKEVMAQYFHMSQSLAAKLLGVSVSTLKRRYYELFKGGQRWPFQSIPLKERKKSIYYLVNEEEPLNAKELDTQTMTHLCSIFEKCTPIVSSSASESSGSSPNRSTSVSPFSSSASTTSSTDIEDESSSLPTQEGN